MADPTAEHCCHLWRNDLCLCPEVKDCRLVHVLQISHQNLGIVSRQNPVLEQRSNLAGKDVLARLVEVLV